MNGTSCVDDDGDDDDDDDDADDDDDGNPRKDPDGTCKKVSQNRTEICSGRVPGASGSAPGPSWNTPERRKSKKLISGRRKSTTLFCRGWF